MHFQLFKPELHVRLVEVELEVVELGLEVLGVLGVLHVEVHHDELGRDDRVDHGGGGVDDGLLDGVPLVVAVHGRRQDQDLALLALPLLGKLPELLVGGLLGLPAGAGVVRQSVTCKGKISAVICSTANYGKSQQIEDCWTANPN